LVSKVLSDEVTLPNWEQEPTASALLTRALNGSDESSLDCQLTLKQPIVAIGAPVEAYMPRAAQQLQTELVIPDHADVANALGAVAGGVVLQTRVLIQPLEGDSTSYRAHMSNGVHDFDTLADSVAYAQSIVPGQLKALTRQAGADQVEVQMVREDHSAPVKGRGEEIHLHTELIFTATGRPSLAQ
jgi:N-methylhydantoinase A/oxoprolinase/acetone carboxylase beta subunit